MEIHKVTLYVIDHNEMGEEDVKDTLECTRYSNHCMNPEVALIETREIGEWHDDIVYNLTDKSMQAMDDLFKKT